MLNELQNLVPSKKEQKLQVFVNQLINDLYNNKKIEVDSEKLLELLSYLTSDENISTQMKSCVEVQNRRITDILHKKEVEHLKKYIEYLKENSILKQKVKEKIEENNKLIEKCKDELEHYGEIYLYEHDNKILKELLEDK
nr:MAG TPA: hypothetical protein [Caudoviricetes sp.]